MKTIRLACILVAVSLSVSCIVRAELIVRLKVPADFPVDLPTVVSGELQGVSLPHRTFSLSHPKFRDQSLVGQSDDQGRRVCIALSVPSDAVGTTLDLQAVEVETAAILKIKEESEDTSSLGIEGVQGAQVMLDGDRAVLVYHAQPMTRHEHTRAGFVHPVRGLDGETLTEIFPADHRHHHGIFWAWHQLWINDEKIGDPWITKNHLVDVSSVAESHHGPVFTQLDIIAHWTAPTLTDPIVNEKTTIRLYRANGDTQYADFTIRLTACLPNVKIGGSENIKGYSGFTVRVKPPDDMQILDEHGIRTEDAVQTASSWAGVSGSFGVDGISGVAILSHPSLRQFPPRWLLRHYGMQNVAYPGRDPVPLSTQQPLVIRHRLVLHRGETEHARIPDHQQVYELTP